MTARRPVVLDHDDASQILSALESGSIDLWAAGMNISLQIFKRAGASFDEFGVDEVASCIHVPRRGRGR